VALGQVEDALHLTARDHSSFIHDEHVPAQSLVRCFIFHEPGDGHGIAEADLVQFFNRAPRWSHRQHLMPCMIQPTMNLSESCRLPGTSSATQIDRQIA
jgi:hypothetical protein